MNDSADREQVFISQMEEKWKGFRAEVIKEGRVALVRLPMGFDSSEPVWIPVFDPDPRLNVDLYLILGEVDKVGEVSGGKLSKGQAETMSWAVSDLGLPVVVAVHAVLNQGMDKNQMREMFGEARIGETISTVVALTGPARAGKSMFARYMEIKYGVTSVSADGYGAVTLAKYKEARTIRDLLSMKINDIRGSGEWSVTMALDAIVEEYRDGKRPAVLIVDFPGYHIDENGMMTRPKSTIDVLGKQGMLSVAMSRYRGENDTEVYPILKDGPIDVALLNQYAKSFWEQFNLLGRMSEQGNRHDFVRLCKNVAE